MDTIKTIADAALKINEGWDKLPKAAKPAAVGVGVLISLTLPKLFVAIGVAALFGQRTVHKLGLYDQIIKEEADQTDELEKADESPA